MNIKVKAGRVVVPSMVEAKDFALDLISIGFIVYTRALKNGAWSVTAYENKGK